MGLERRAGGASRASERLGMLALVLCDTGRNWGARSRGPCVWACSARLAAVREARSGAWSELGHAARPHTSRTQDTPTALGLGAPRLQAIRIGVCGTAAPPQEPPAEATEGLTASSPPAGAPAARCCHVSPQWPTPSARLRPAPRLLGRRRASPGQAAVTGSAAALSLFTFRPVLLVAGHAGCSGSSSPSTGGSLLLPLWGLQAASLASSPLSSPRVTEPLRRSPAWPSC